MKNALFVFGVTLMTIGIVKLIVYYVKTRD